MRHLLYSLDHLCHVSYTLDSRSEPPRYTGCLVLRAWVISFLLQVCVRLFQPDEDLRHS
jgi:hypothetical protein